MILPNLHLRESPVEIFPDIEKPERLVGYAYLFNWSWGLVLTDRKIPYRSQYFEIPVPHTVYVYTSSDGIRRVAYEHEWWIYGTDESYVCIILWNADKPDIEDALFSFRIIDALEDKEASGLRKVKIPPWAE